MVYLQIKELEFRNYKINLEILENQTVGVYAQDKGLVKSFLDLLSGINNNKKTCFFKNEDIYDNKDYFKNRIYFDFSKKYLSTLKVNYLEERLKNKYGLSFNKEKFVKITKDLDVRGETEISYVYNFTQAGNTFVNYALVSSLEKSNIIVNNPTIGLKYQDDISYIVKGLTNKENYNSVILGLNNISPFNNCLDKIILFTDDQVLMFNGLETLIVFEKKYFNIDNILYESKNIIAINSYSKDELKDFARQNFNYKVISIYDLNKYLEVKND